VNARVGPPPRRQRILPFKFLAVRRRFGDRPFRLLDVGAGNHGATLAKACFPACHYTGIDRDRGYNNDPADFARMDAFHELDLTRLEFGALPDGGFDLVMLAHVIEHLPNGDEVLRRLVPKLAPGGMMYVEFPGPRSLRLPSMRGTLNFHDDDTHVRVFTAAEVAGVLADAGLRVLRAGTRRDWRGIALLPLKVAHARWRHGFVPGSAFWDVLGFAEVVIADRPE
jgi:2-polyprenyl-3-methyl-5-hydroxy-6-metoxy-1,4-benzoquinol methylase